jgi:probable rRNA maturation factor
MLGVSIANQQERVELDYQRLKAAARAVLEGEMVKKSKITLAFMTDAAIHALNKKFLEHDEPTDVITFPYSSPKAASLEGDIAISTDTAVRAAEERGHATADELVLYVIHGVLHLCGYDDLDEEERKIMRGKESEYLERLKIRIGRDNTV